MKRRCDCGALFETEGKSLLCPGCVEKNRLAAEVLPGGPLPPPVIKPATAQPAQVAPARDVLVAAHGASKGLLARLKIQHEAAGRTLGLLEEELVALERAISALEKGES